MTKILKVYSTFWLRAMEREVPPKLSEFDFYFVKDDEYASDYVRLRNEDYEYASNTHQIT